MRLTYSVVPETTATERYMVILPGTRGEIILILPYGMEEHAVKHLAELASLAIGFNVRLVRSS